MKVQFAPKVNVYIATAEDTAAIHKLNIKKGVEQELLVLLKEKESLHQEILSVLSQAQCKEDTVLSSFIVHFKPKFDTGR